MMFSSHLNPLFSDISLGALDIGQIAVHLPGGMVNSVAEHEQSSYVAHKSKFSVNAPSHSLDEHILTGHRRTTLLVTADNLHLTFIKQHTLFKKMPTE
jgi:hypothetical protein